MTLVSHLALALALQVDNRKVHNGAQAGVALQHLAVQHQSFQGQKQACSMEALASWLASSQAQQRPRRSPDLRASWPAHLQETRRSPGRINCAQQLATSWESFFLFV